MFFAHLAPVIQVFVCSLCNFVLLVPTWYRLYIFCFEHCLIPALRSVLECDWSDVMTALLGLKPFTQFNGNYKI